MLKNESKQAVDNFFAAVDTEFNAFLHSRTPEEYEAAAQLILESQAQGGRIHVTGIGKCSHVATYVASLMSTWVFFAGPGGYYRGGLGYWVSEMSYIILFPVVAHFTMNKVWLLNHARHYTTPADFYDDRFHSPVLRVILALVFLVSSFPYVSSVLISIGQAAQVATGGAADYRAVILIVGLAIIVYVCLGRCDY